MLRGLTTVTFYADDLSAAIAGYTDLLGTHPYFVREIGGSPSNLDVAASLAARTGA